MHGPLRTIFSLSILVLWVLFGIGLWSGQWTSTHWLLLGLAHACCLVIFLQFAWVFNYGYGLSVLACALALMALHPTPAGLLTGAIAALFGLRMLQFTHTRYTRSAYSTSGGRKHRQAPAVPVPFRIMMWVFVSWLMAGELMALAFIARDGALTPWVLAGAALMLAGLLMETVADQQKQSAKARDPEAFVSTGLYRLMRHPNYTGEIVFQVGIIVSCLGVVDGWWQLALSVVAPAYIVVLMVWSSGSLDESQQARFGADPAWQNYRARTGGLLPRVG
jgi:steroid 5-alpha reductase family enzyme